MSMTLRQLAPHQRDALRGALASLLKRHFAYAAYFDFRRNALQYRPVDNNKQLEIIRYVQQTPLDLDVALDTPAMERWVAQTLLGFANINAALASTRASNKRQALVRRAREAAADLCQHRLSGLLRNPPILLPAEAPRSWLGASDNHARANSVVVDHERQTQMIALVLARPHPPAQAKQPVSESERPGTSGTAANPPASGAQGGLFGFGRKKPQAQQPVVETPGLARPREASADLLQLYGEYLSDMQPEMTTHETAAIPRAPTAYGGSSGALPGAGDAQTDMQLFYQLRFQIEGYVRKAARSYGLPDLPGDPARVIEALRGSNLVDESDLRMAEGVLALADRVIADGIASMQDYRQALMLYLLYHRSHLA